MQWVQKATQEKQGLHARFLQQILAQESDVLYSCSGLAFFLLPGTTDWLLQFNLQVCT